MAKRARMTARSKELAENKLKREAASALVAELDTYIPQIRGLILAWGRGAVDGVLELKLRKMLGKEHATPALQLLKAYRDIYFTGFKESRKLREELGSIAMPAFPR